MKFNLLISLTLFAALIFVVSCGGTNAEGNAATSETTCTHDGAFSCKENAVLKCENKEWQKIEQCAKDQKCNPAKGICETVDENGDTSSDADTDEPDTTQDNLDTDDADTTSDSGDSQPDTDSDTTTDNDEQSTPDGGDSTSDDDETEAVEINDEASCIDAGGAWNSGNCTKSATCTGLPENAVWNKASGIRQTWNGTEWEPSEVGSYSETPSTSECVFKCKTNYEWNAETLTCDGATKQTSCTGLPSGAEWNNASSITQTWSGSEWLPSTSGIYSESASEDECRFKCATNYTWNGSSCAADTRTADCSSRPANTVWNDNDKNGKFTQTWNGSDWAPATYASGFSKTAGICKYVCVTGYIWSENQCITAPTQTASCTGLPSNAQWNTATSITQTYDGSEWYPSTEGVYNATASTMECRFKCKEHYSWKNSQCVADTQVASCAGLPANAQWNTASSITQTWSGSEWLPTTTGVYNTTSSTSECRYKCGTNYNWNSSTSTCDAATQQANCSSKPANTVWNDNGANGKFTQTWSGSAWDPASYASSYNKTAGTCRYVCATGYLWNGSACETAPTQSANCTGLPANAQWNTASSITQTYDGSSWYPSTAGVYNTTASTSECRYKCKEHYSWKNSQCVADTQTANCTGLPANASWNTVSSITQTWNGSSWQPTTTGVYDTTSSTSECRFGCNMNYNWNSSTSKCDAATQQANCSSKPANTVWNDSGANGKFTQTWSGTSWSPASYTSTYNTTAGVCRYQCADSYHTENGGSSCISNTKTGVACTGLPSNAQWNTASSITQTWNGSSWTPTTTGIYNTTASTSQCRYKCKDSYHTEDSGASCISNTKTGVACTGLPSNAQWNTATSITQTWNGSAWTPTATGSFNNTASTSECRYKCKTNYNWSTSTSTCDAAKQTVNCTDKPANTVWNTVSTVTQTWTGSAWSPSNTSIYNETASTSECRYKCDSTHFWYNSQCTSPCDSLPCSGIENSTGTCNAYALEEYVCGCQKNGFSWNSSQCILSLGNICTGQTECYYQYSMVTCPNSLNDNYYAQDAYYAALGKCVKQNFTVKTNLNKKVVIDNNTGLQWQQTIPVSKYTSENAKTYCNNLSYAGYSDWRLPTFKELLTIVDIGKYNPATDTTYFPNTYKDKFWSSSSPSQYGDSAYIINFANGVLNTSDTSSSNSYYVRCVRGNALEEPTFYSLTVNNDDISVDTKTGLIWQTTIQATNFKTWEQALSHCENLNYAGYIDWRLPNRNELTSLINPDYNYSNSSYLETPAGGGLTDIPRYWSSSVDVSAESSPNIWLVYYSSTGASSSSVSPYVGNTYPGILNSYSVRCVRN